MVSAFEVGVVGRKVRGVLESVNECASGLDGTHHGEEVLGDRMVYHGRNRGSCRASSYACNLVVEVEFANENETGSENGSERVLCSCVYHGRSLGLEVVGERVIEMQTV